MLPSRTRTPLRNKRSLIAFLFAFFRLCIFLPCFRSTTKKNSLTSLLVQEGVSFCIEGIILSQSIMPQLDKFTYFTQFFWSCLFLFTFYIPICNDGDGVLGISRILKLRNQLVSHRENNMGSNDPKSFEDILRKGFSTGVSYMYSSLFDIKRSSPYTSLEPPGDAPGRGPSEREEGSLSFLPRIGSLVSAHVPSSVCPASPHARGKV